MDCRIVTVEQGTEEWDDLRRGRITCSRLADVMSKPKKCPKCKATGKILSLVCPDCEGKGEVRTKRHRQYMQEKVLELLGNREVEQSPEWARHGRENEPRALAGYQYKFGVDVEHNLMLIHKKYDFISCSPDLMHLPKYDEGGEIKCRELYKNYRKERAYAENNKGKPICVPSTNRHQIQGAMWLTGFKYWWYVNYYVGDDLAGGMTQKIHRVAVPRDQALIDQMEAACIEFMTEAYDRAGLELKLAS
jgi:hypothetical protein